MWLLNTKTARLQFFRSAELVPGGYAILSHVWGPDAEEDTFQKVQHVAKVSEGDAVCSRPGPAGRSATDFAQIVKQQQREIHQQQKAIDQLQRMFAVLSTGIEQSTSEFPTAAVINSPPSHQYENLGTSSNMFSTMSDMPRIDGDSSPIDPRDLVSTKIRNFLIEAERLGFEWAWADTCCIDKTSSAELTEAINSMFRYYTLADLCFVYLADVRSTSTSENSEFNDSRWHERGWTLQELLAPKTILFVTRDWTPIGTKYELAGALARITTIPESVLRFEKDITEMSVGVRMSWAAQRKTTRVEDEAYSLFGIFGINMPTLYGEGRNAFYRLQEEIMRTSIDTSLFMWGFPVFEGAAYFLQDMQGYPFGEYSDPTSRHLLAQSPAEFAVAGIYHSEQRQDTIPLQYLSSASSLSPIQGSQLTSFTLTPHGVLVHTPLISPNDTYALANLSCFLTLPYSHAPCPVWLPLQRDPYVPFIAGLPHYTCGFFHEPNKFARIYVVTDSSSYGALAWRWRDVYISLRPAYRADPLDAYGRLARLALGPPSAPPPFVIRRATIAQFEREHGWALESVARVPTPWTGAPPLVLAFKRSNDFVERLTFALGKCTASIGRNTGGDVLYARVQFDRPGGEAAYAPHACPDDHVMSWPDLSRTFTGELDSWEARITISFARSPLHTAGRSLELRIERFEVGHGTLFFTV